MTLIDTHTHLFTEQFDVDRAQVVEKALAHGVRQMLLPNIDETTLQPMLNLCKQFPKHCHPMIGIHPCSVKENVEQQLQTIKKSLWENSERCVAVGEIGMDLYWDKTFLEEQKYAFRQQISWAKQLKIPIAIHVREAFDEVLAIVDELNDERLSGVFHCFTGTLKEAEHILSYGNFYLGIGGVVTYKKSTLPEVLSQINVKHIVLETDSPYLAPTPFRGKRNESAFLVHIAQKLCEIYGLTNEQIAEITTKNAQKLFHIRIE